MPFIGQFTHVVDAQRRFAIPAHWREVSASFYLVPGFKKRVHIIPQAQFEQLFSDAATNVSWGNEELSDTLANIGGAAHFATCDKGGRINLTPELAAHAEITNEVILIGSVKDIQLYHPAHWAASRKPFDQVLKYVETIQHGAPAGQTLQPAAKPAPKS